MHLNNYYNVVRFIIDLSLCASIKARKTKCVSTTWHG